jgi:hypothetical protein
MNNLLAGLVSKSNLISVISLFVLLAVSFGIINGKAVGTGKLKQITNGVEIIDMEPGYSVEKAYDILEKQGAEGRNYYLKRIIPMDFIFPATYMLFYASAILFLLKLLRSQNAWVNYIVFFPLLAALCDYFENFAIIRMLINYPQKLILSAKAANIFTLSKLAFIYTSWAGILVLTIIVLFRFLASKVSFS